MKNILTSALLILLFACNAVKESEPVDLAAEEAAINDVFSTLFQSVEDRNIDQLASVFADDGLFMGSDPSEILPKDTIVAGWSQMMKMEEIPPFKFIGDPLIRIHPDGKSAIYVNQYYWGLFTELPLRQSFWLVKRETGWLIEFFDFSLVPYNEQIPVLNEALAPKKS